MEHGKEPATKADIALLRSEVHQQGEQLRSEFHHGFDHLKEAVRDNQTEVLKAFYSFAESNQKRISEIETESAAIKSPLSTLEDRLLNVEKRLNMPA
jgi:hypothetical protein